MNSIQWKRIAQVKDLKQGIPRVVEVEGEEILLILRNGEVQACGNKCTHYGGPLSEGFWEGDQVTCPWHFARFNIRNGKMVTPPALDDLPRYQLKVEKGEVLIGKKEKSAIPKSKGKDSRTVLVLGAGAAGNAAAETLRREGFAGQIQMVTAEQDLPYDRPNLSKSFLAGKAKPSWLPLRSEKFYADHKIEVLKGHLITEFNPRDKVAVTDKGKSLHYDLCLLATGGTPRKLTVPGANLKNIFTLRSFQDAKNIIAAVENGTHRVLVAGAGFIGMETASSLRGRNLQVQVAAPETVPLENVLGKRIGKRLHTLHEEKGVQFHFGCQVESFQGNDSVKEVMLSDGSRIPVDMVIVGIGIDPEIAYLKNSKLSENGSVPVNERMETKEKGVFAAGDIALFPRMKTDKTTRIEHWAVAESQGQHAARAMLGNPESYREIPFFWTMQYDFHMKYIGYPGDADSIEYLGDVDKGSFLAGFFKGEKLSAAATIGGGKELFQIRQQMMSGNFISPQEFKQLFM